MLARRIVLALAVALLLAVAPAALAARPVALPAVTERVAGTPARGTSCATDRVARTAGGARYTAPMSGHLSVDLAGRGDWDLVLRDTHGRRIGASQGTSGSELVQTWIGAGQTVVAIGCRRPGATGSATTAFTLVDVAPKRQLGPSKLVKVRASGEQLERLEDRGFDVTHDVGDGTANVLVHGADQTRALRRTGLRQRVLVGDVAAKDRRARLTERTSARRARSAAAAPALPSGRTEYRTYESIQAEMKDLAAKNPDLVRTVSIGKSFQGRDVVGLEIADDVKGTDGRPVFFLMGIHHAREWPAAEAVMEFAQAVLRGKADPTYAALLKSERMVLVPLVNPDGYIVSRAAVSPGDELGGDENITLAESIAPPGGFGAYRRKNCDPVQGGPEIPCELAAGVDNNRNYGNLWGGPGGSPDITSQAFHGLSPRSEPETQNVWNYVRTHHVSMLITVHTVAGLVLRPPGLAQLGLAPDEQRMKEVGDEIGRRSGYESQFSWQLYDTAGTTEDDTYAATGGYGYTIEMGPKDGPFHGAYQTSVVDQWTGEYAPAKQAGGGGLGSALTYAAQVAARREDHAVLKGTAPPGRVLRLKKQFETKTSEFCPVGVEPVIDPGLPASEACPEGRQAPITLKDEVNTTTTVPAGGVFDWHIGQSTRPFVGGGATVFTFKDLPTIAELTAGPGAPGSASFTLPFKIAPNTASALVDLTSTAPTDQYRLTLSRKNADGSLTELESHNYIDTVGEQIALNPAPAGDYVVTIDNVAAATAFTVKVTGRTATSTVTTGRTEAYRLTCEDTAGTVLESHDLTIGRGQQVVATLACGTPGASKVSAAGPQDDVVPTPPAAGTTAPAGAPTPASSARPGLSGTPFRAGAAVDRTSLRRALRQGLRVRLRANRAYRAVITLRDASGRTIRRVRLGARSGRRTVRVTTRRMRRVASVRIQITDVQTGTVRTFSARGKIRLR
jgi:hypothetical protein